MNSKSVLIHFYTLINKGIKIWVQHENIKLFVPKDVIFGDEDKDFIKSNKVEILGFLCNSNVYSKEYTPLIIKTNFNFADLSYAQERLWFIEKYEQGTSAYNIPMVFKTEYDDKEIELLEKSLRSIVSRHEILRTLIKQDDEGNGYQLVLDDKEHPLEIRKIRVENQSKLDEEIEKEVKHIYDLSNEYPIRVCVYELYKEEAHIPKLNKTDNIEYYISVIIHHIAFDGWSTDIFIKELQEYYRYYSNQSKGLESRLNLPELSVQYKDFAMWQRAYLNGEKLEKQLAYWKNKLYEYETLNLVTDKIRPKEIDYKGKDICFEIDEDVSNKLRILAKELKVSLYTVLLAAYYLLLRAYSNQNDIVVGTPIANRHYTQVENLIGFFVNTLVLRIEVDSNDFVTEFIEKIGREVIEAQLHQDLPFERLVEEIEVTKDTSRHPIFQVMFSVQSFGSGLQWQRNKSTSIDQTNLINLLQPYETESSLYNIAKFDLSILIDDSQPTLKGIFEYAISLYERETVIRFIDTYTKILNQVADLADKKIKTEQEQIKITNITYLSERNHKHIVYDLNNNDNDYPSDKTISQLFEEQVKKTPDNIAVVYEDIRLTYQELNNRANSLAHYLIQNHNIKPDTLIALFLDRSEYMLIAILATLKAGAAYVPIDPSYPDERIKYILEDTATKLTLTNEVYKQKLKNLVNSKINKSNAITANSLAILDKEYKQVKILSIDDISFQNKLSSQSTQTPITSTASNNLAYVIYTSGTTGNPKGVMIEHKGVVNLQNDLTVRYEIDNKNNHEVILQFANYIFDASVEQIVLSLLNGHTLLLISNYLWANKEKFNRYLLSNKATYFESTPTFLDQYDLSPILSIKRLVLGGEVLSKSCYEKLRSSNKYVKIINTYGPTEASITSTVNIDQDNLTIGFPISNTRCYVLDTNLTPLPIGAVGELYIGGIGLARGYLNRPDLTGERFIPNPFQSDREKQDISYGKNGRNARLYKTGDLVRWLPDGSLEYIGRNDFQVKIRGYRIELGEIESVLSQYPGITQSVVIAKEHNIRIDSNNKYLVGYYTSDKKLNEEFILTYLKSKLPEYMIPSILVYIEKLPLTHNGKLDRNALPDPEFIGDQDNYVAPKTELEKKVCSIWSEVLGLPEDKVGIHNDFFRLGGNSILAIKLASKLNKELNNSTSVSSIFKYNTVDKLIHYLMHNNEDITIIELSNVSKLEEQDLSYAQERLWFIEKYEQGTSAYNIPMVFKTEYDDKEIELLEKSLRSIVSRHEILRTLIKQDDEGNGYQLVLDDKEHPLEIRKIRVENQSKLDEEIEKEVKHIYDLSNEYPIRVCVYELYKEEAHIPKLNKTDNIEYYISVIIHHIAFDGWSTDIFIKELQEYYRYYSNQSKGLESRLNLPELSVQYKDFAMWQRAYLNGEKLEKQLAYWKNKLYEYETLNLVTDKIRPKEIDYKGKDICFEIDEDVSNKLRILAKELKVSLYTVLLAAYYLLLRAYSNQNDIVVGTPIANRHYTQVENLIGFFVNTLVLRIEVDSNDFVTEFIEKIGREVIEAQLHQDLPFERLVEEIEVTKDTSRHPIFQVMFSVQSFGSGLQWQRNKSTSIDQTNLINLLQPYETESSLYNIAKFDLSILIDDSQPTLKGIFEYAISLYERETVIRFIDTYTKILNQVADLADKKIKTEQEQIKITNITYLSERNHKHIIYDLNNNDNDYPSDKTISQLFEEQVKKTPDNIAVVYEDIRLTYQELNNRANSLAHYLIQNHNIKPDTLIALFLDRSEYMLIAILATLKAGAAYVPIDPSYPDERIKYILEDTNTKIILTNELHKIRLHNLCDTINCDDITSTNESIVGTSNLIYLDKSAKQLSILPIDSTLFQDQLSVRFVQAPITSTTSRNLAYVIYTSGTTGNPKGVMIEHKGVVNLAMGKTNTSGEAFNDTQHIKKCLWYANYIFDAHIWELYASIFNGSTIYIVNNDVRQSTALLESYINDNLIDTALLSPTLLDKTTLLKLKVILVGGDKANKEILDYYVKGNIDIVNAYGPTEITLYSNLSYHDSDGPLNIGSPISNTKSYILSHTLTPLPIGAIGELYIGGVGLARGYLNRPDLTAEKFIANPFQTEEEKRDKTYGLNGRNSRMYKTGDLVRWLSDGNLEYKGRNDFQVKIRGYRIELSEIESVLNQYPGIIQSVVLDKNSTIQDSNNTTNNDKYLVGYYVSDEPLDEESILIHLKKKLPEYMVPSILMHLDKLPLTINSKLDRKALPDPELTNSCTYTAPRDEIEKQLVRILSEVLGLPEDKVGIYDNFFQLGGHSLKATQVVARIRSCYQIDLPLRSLFEHPTIDTISRLIKEAIGQEQQSLPSLSKQIREEVIPLSFAQQRLWFLDQLIENKAVYNIPVALRLKGRLDIVALENSLKKIVERHESLRTYFKVIEGEAQQLVANNVSLSLQQYDLSKVDKKKEKEQQIISIAKAEAIEMFDLNRAPLIRIKLLILGSTEHVVLITMHHIISDGWSMGILVQEVSKLYNHYAYGKSLDLDELPVQYVDYAIWQRGWLKGGILKEQLLYWQEKLQDIPEALNLPFDKVRPMVSSYVGKTYNKRINKELVSGLQKIGEEKKVTLYMTLLAVVQVLLYRYSNQEDIVIGSPIAGRRHKEIEGLIGFFVNTLVLRSNLRDNPRFTKLLQMVRESVLEAYAHQDIPFEQLVDHLKVSRDLGRHPIFQVMLALQNTNREQLGLEKLKAELLTIDNNQSKFDLTFNISEERSSGELLVSIEYASDLFYDETIERMGNHLEQLIESIIQDSEQHIDALNLLTDKERHQLLIEWNDTDRDYPKDKTIHQLFEEQVERTPDSIAVVYEEQHLSYRELNEKANQLAHYLVRLGVKTEIIVGLCIQRSLEMVIAILGILKARGAYLPIDPSYPEARRNYLINNSKIKLILTSNKQNGKLNNFQGTIIYVDNVLSLSLSIYNIKDIHISSNNLAYIIYTSGSTGHPKGAQLCHRGLVNLILSQINDFDIRHDSNILQFASFSFDACASEIFSALLSGAKLVLGTSEQLRPGEDLIEFLNYNQIDIVTLPPSLLLNISQAEVPYLRTIVSAGEMCPINLPMRWNQCKRFINVYGPTEITVCATNYICTKDIDLYVPVGKPLPNVKVYVLDKHLQPVPIGVNGEIYIDSIGIAKGYLNNAKLTAEKFISNPFTLPRLTKFYRSGDIGKWSSDGNLIILGRIDEQVKINGYRIELGEIEQCLSRHPAVKECIVVVKENREKIKQLIGYVILKKNTGSISTDTIKIYISTHIPKFMIPSHIVFLENWPLTPNLKIDKTALLAIQIKPQNTQYASLPKTNTEIELAKIWSEVLDIKQVYNNNNFFDLGGHSILAVRLSALVREKLGTNMHLDMLFKYPTLTQLAHELEKETNNQGTNNLITMQPLGVKRPIFCIHPAGGNIIFYKDLAKNLGNNQPFYAFRAIGIEEGELPLADLRKIATQYISQILNKHNNEEYILMGWSLGAVIAYEMAQQLKSSNKTVSKLILIDPANPKENELTSHMYENFIFDAGKMLDTLGSRYNIKEIQSLKLEEQINTVAHLIQQQNSNFSSGEIDNIRKYLTRLANVYKNNIKALHNYQPIKYVENIHLLYASNPKVVKEQKISLEAWKSLCPNLNLVQVEGNHYSILEEPFVKALVRKVQKICKQN